jgi:hypothetical protein
MRGDETFRCTVIGLDCKECAPPIGKGFRVTPGIYREVYSRSLSRESFRQGTTYSMVLTRFFQ